MNRKFLIELNKLDDIEFRLLEWHLYVAKMVRNTMTEYGISNKEMCSILGITEKKLLSATKEAYEFDLRFLSKIEAYRQERAYEEARLKVSAEGIQFAKYKDQFPYYVEKLEKLLSILEKQYPESQ